MSVFRAAGNWVVCAVLGLIVFGPIAALCAAAVLERGPEGAARSSIFSAAVTALDPFVWTCVRNSMAAAGAAAAGSILVGVFVGRLVGDWRFPARPVLIAAMNASAVVPPAIVALGLASLFGAGANPSSAWLGPLTRFVPGDWRWYGWLWAAIVQGGSITALACLSAQGGIDPSWRDAARLAGGTRSRVWRKLNWPLLRPAIARASGLVFTLTIADPGAPMILGLRRTVGYQIVAAGLRDDPFPSIAVLGLIAVVVCVVVRAILNGWAGPEPILRPSVSQEARPLRSASRRRRAVAVAITVFWGVVSVGPLFAVVGESAQGGAYSGVRPGALLERLLDPTFGEIAAHSGWLGLWVCVLFFLTSWLARSASSGFGPSRALLSLLHAGAAPPLVMGVAALSLPRLAGLAAGSFDVSSPGVIGSLLRATAAAPDLFPYLIPALAVWLAMTPTLLASWDVEVGPGRVRDDRVAAAMLAGARWARARRLASAWSRAEVIRRFALTGCLAATNIAPALLLAHRDEIRTIGPGVLLLREDPEYGLGPASALAVAALAINVIVIMVCSPAIGATSRTRPAIAPNGEPTRR